MKLLAAIMIFVFIASTSYSSIELTRYIVAFTQGDLSFKFLFEIIYIWIGYLIGLSVIGYLIYREVVRRLP